MKPLTSREDALKNRDRFNELLAQFGLTQQRAAELIAEQTSRPCSIRTVRSWLNDENSSGWRPCPAWAVAALDTRTITLKLPRIEQ